MWVWVCTCYGTCVVRGQLLEISPLLLPSKFWGPNSDGWTGWQAPLPMARAQECGLLWLASLSLRLSSLSISLKITIVLYFFGWLNYPTYISISDGHWLLWTSMYTFLCGHGIFISIGDTTRLRGSFFFVVVVSRSCQTVSKRTVIHSGLQHRRPSASPWTSGRPFNSVLVGVKGILTVFDVHFPQD